MSRSSSFVAMLLALFLGSAARAEHDVGETRLAMNQLLQNLRIVLPLSVDPTRFAAPDEQKTIESALQGMVAAASSLDSHTKGFDPGRRFVGRSLTRDLEGALHSFQAKDYRRSEFLLHETVNACVSCHSRIESDTDSPVAKDFLDDPALAALDPMDRAELQIATRRFDSGLSTFEEIFAAPTLPSAGLVNALTEYLTVNIRVKHDFERPIPVLTKLSERPELYTQLRENSRAWAGDLRALANRPQPEPSVAAARSLLDEGKALADYPASRRPLVYYLNASQLLSEFVAADEPPAADRAEAYFLLGTTETRISPDFWSSPADFYLEQAIRLAPHSATAQRAFGVLEEATVLEFTGSRGTRLPAAAEAHLKELRGLAAKK